MHTLFIFEVLVEFDDIWMIEFLQDFYFRLESCGVLNFLFWDGFHGSHLLGGQMLSLTNDTECATPESLFRDLVMLFEGLIVFDDEG